MWAKPLFVGAILASLFATPNDAVAQSGLSLTVDQTRQLSLALLEEGDAQQAGSLAEKLLARDPKDVTALIVASRAAAALGLTQASGDFARRAYWASNGGNASFAAARLAANAFATERKDTRAQLWLRRAVQYSPDQANSDAIARDYRSLTRRNPWSNSLRFGITPKSNINGGSDESFFFEGFDFSTPPRSGLQYSGNASTTYRANANATSATFVDGFLNFNLYSLSSYARSLEPPAKGSDFGSGSLGYGLRHRQILIEGARPSEFGLRVAQNWAEGEVDNRTVDLSFSQSWEFAESTRINAYIARQFQVFKDDDPANSWSSSLTWTQAIGKDRLQLSFGATRSRSDQREEGFSSQRISGSYDFGARIEGFFVGVDFSYENRDYDKPSAFATEDRTDITKSATLRIGNENIEYYGFQPFMTISQMQVDSTFDFYDRDFLSVGFDLRSSF